MRRSRPTRLIAVGSSVILLFAACAGGDDTAERDDDARDTELVSSSSTAPGSTRLDIAGDTGTAIAGEAVLGAASTWQWQLQGDVDTSHDVDVYDVDLFDVPDRVLDELGADGRVVVCYFSAGSYEEWRDDVDGFASADLGATLDGWDGERWLDTRSPSVRAVMERRLDVAAERGCDGVEPDNVTAYSNDTGFDLTVDDQLDFNRFLADAAHARGLLVGLKNALDLIPDLVDHFDFAVNEQCHEYDECDVYGQFVEQDKAVFNAEYDQRFVDDPDAVCTRARELGLRTLVLPLDLDGSFRIGCDD